MWETSLTHISFVVTQDLFGVAITGQGEPTICDYDTRPQSVHATLQNMMGVFNGTRTGTFLMIDIPKEIVDTFVITSLKTAFFDHTQA